jgi:DNA-binding transcriptional LysR family regulator
MKRPRITLDQWIVFQTVIDENGFANAAEKLGRSQSTISYGIHKLESLLNTKLLKQNGRKAELTESGRQILLRARQIIQFAAALEQQAVSITDDIESEISIAFDSILPKCILLDVLDRFAKLNLTTRIILREEILSGPVECFASGKADIAIVSKVPSNIIGEKICDIESVVYAHPDHVLHQLMRPLTEIDLQTERHIVVMDSGTKENRSEGWLSSQYIWNVDSIDLKIKLVAQGLGFAWLPKLIVESNNVELKPLPLINGATRYFPLYLITHPTQKMRPACTQLLELFRECSAKK